MVLPRISKSFIEHVLKRHKDWIEVLKLKSMVEIENHVREVLKTPDEVYRDRVRVDVEYYLKKNRQVLSMRGGCSRRSYNGILYKPGEVL
jgi:hypothetical protein